MKKISCRILSLLLSVLMVCLLAEPVCAGESVSAQGEMVQTPEAAESRSEQPEDNNAEAETREPVEVSSVGISRSELDLVVGETAKLSAAISPDNADNKAVSWVSANTAVAAVDGSGIVTAKASGNTVITVTSEDGGLAASCNVTVNAPAEKDASDKAGVSAENENASAAFDGSAASTAGNDVSNGKSSKKNQKRGQTQLMQMKRLSLRKPQKPVPAQMTQRFIKYPCRMENTISLQMRISGKAEPERQS